MTFGPKDLIPYVDRPVRPRHAHHYQHNSESDSYHHQGALHIRGLPAAAARLSDPRLRCERNLGWSIEWAVAFVVDFLDARNSPRAADGLRDVRVRAAHLDRQGCAKEIPYRLFTKLDETLFAGHLKNAVFVDIRRLGPDVSGATHSQGWSINPRVKRASIILNSDVLQDARPCDIVATLIHHMIHAYFLIACGPQDPKEVEYGRLNHGPHFAKISMTIRELSGLHGKQLPLDIGHTLNGASHFYESYRHRRKPLCSHQSKQRWYCSHCCADVEGPSDDDTDTWYASACKPLLHLPDSIRSSLVQIYNDRQHTLDKVSRGQTMPSCSSIEFLFNDSSVIVPNSHMDAFPSIRRAAERSGSRYLEITDVLQDTFERFLELLHTGTYGPDPKHIVALGGRGPPVIKAPTMSEPYLATDIAMFKMGAVMGFKELRGSAIDRMYRHGITHEDPVALLAAIFDGSEPESELKAWAHKFLARVPGVDVDDAWTDGDMGVPMAQTGEPSNLAKLEADMLGFRPRFLELLQRSSALKYAVARARQELVRLESFGVPARYAGVGVTFANGGRTPLGLGFASSPTMSMGVGLGLRNRILGLPWGAEDMHTPPTPRVVPVPVPVPVPGDAYLGHGGGEYKGGWYCE